MEFFNKKEEVIEVILTQKGKELFSMGQLNPVYYSFHDVDIIYDDGSGEEQNSTVQRIKDTPTLKSNSCIQYYQQTVKKKDFKMKFEIGSKTYGDQYAPAWNLKFEKSPLFQYFGQDRNNIQDNKHYQLTFSSSIDYDEHTLELIPQFNIQTVYQVANVKELEENKFSIDFAGQDLSLENFKNYIFNSIVSANYTTFDAEYAEIISNKKFTSFSVNSFGEINFGVPTTVYKIFISKIGQELYFLENTYLSSIEELYNSTMINIVNKFNELFPLQLQSVDEFVNLMKSGFVTYYLYDYQSIIELVKSLNNLVKSFEQLKILDITGEELVFFIDKFLNPIKFFPLAYNIRKSLWVIKDPELLLNVEEYNAYESNEKPEYNTEYYYVKDDIGFYSVLDTKEVREKINIFFDNIANLQDVKNIKNIYFDITKADKSLC